MNTNGFAHLLTTIVMIETAAQWLALELWLKFSGNAPISIYLKDHALNAPWLPFLWGVLTAHLFATSSAQSAPFGDKPWWWVVWVIVGLGLIVASWWTWNVPREQFAGPLRILLAPMMLLMVGMACGFLCWPQKVDL
jgi:hypothetical protein